MPSSSIMCCEYVHRPARVMRTPDVPCIPYALLVASRLRTIQITLGAHVYSYLLPSRGAAAVAIFDTIINRAVQLSPRQAQEE